MVNAPGTVDAGFRGELQCIMINHDQKESVTFKRGDRIAQLVFQKVERAELLQLFPHLDEVEISQLHESSHQFQTLNAQIMRSYLVLYARSP